MKYWHICKVMGRVASHLALEVALQTHANVTLIGEDLADYTDQKRLARAQRNKETDYSAFGITLRHLSRLICSAIVRRAAVGKNFGVIVIPEGILEFINEIQVFILKLNTIIAEHNKTHDLDFHATFPRLDDKLEYFGAPELGTNGDLGRNTYEGPGFANVDFSLFKIIPMSRISEEARLQFRVEFFNLFNRVNFHQPEPGIHFPTFGRATETFDAREIQLGVKFIF